MKQKCLSLALAATLALQSGPVGLCGEVKKPGAKKEAAESFDPPIGVEGWPLSLRREGDTVWGNWQFPPVVEWHKKDDGTGELVLRPLIRRKTRNKYDLWYALLWPLITGRKVFGPEGTQDFFLNPLVRIHRQADGLGYRTEFLPAWVGTKETSFHEECRSFGLFPLAGRWYSKLGRDEIRFFLWPLYAYSRIGKRSYHYVLWPLLARYEIDGKTVGGRLWPLVGASDDGQTQKRFFLWPFFHWARSVKNGYNEKGFWFFPLLGKFESPKLGERYFLWPLFTAYREQLKDGRQQHVKNMPWPIVRTVHVDGKRCGVDVWPIHGWYEFGDLRRQYYLWPFFRESITEKKESKKVERSCLLYFRNDTTSPRGQRTWRYFWPLFEWDQKTADGKRETSFGALTLWPAKKSENIHRSYTPIVRLIDYRRNPEGDVRFRLLWGLVRFDRKERKRSFGLLFFNIPLGKSRVKKEASPAEAKKTIMEDSGDKTKGTK